MGFVQVASDPGIVVAIDSAVLVRHLEVPDDVRAFRVSSANVRPPMDNAFCLIKIDGALYVRRNGRILVARFMDAIHQDYE